MFTSDEDREKIHLQLLAMLVKRGGQLWLLDDKKSLVGVLTWNVASTSDFK